MTTYPLPTLACTINAAGISGPAYSDIYQSLQASLLGIYGSDTYIDPDSQDGQMLAIFAQAMYDGNQADIATYNSFSPTTAQGSGLSSNVKINGLQRLIPSNSTADLTIVGVAGTIIMNGIAGDGTGNQWNLPATVTIPIGGSIVVTATAQNAGATTAAPDTITNIITATLGWQTVNNSAAATAGAPVETDAALRVRQSVSTEQAAESIIGAIYGSLANLSGVEELKIYENDTGSADGNGIPAHSISVVIEGGDSVQIATTIEQTKTPGTGTYGSTTEIIIDPVGVPVTINFYRPTIDTILVDITIKALSGYTSSIGAEIVASIVSYINSLGIGANGDLLSISAVLAAAYNTSAPATYNVIISDLLISISPASPGSSDLTIAFNALPQCAATNVTLVVT